MNRLDSERPRNLLKVPNCLNQKKKKRSFFLVSSHLLNIWLMPTMCQILEDLKDTRIKEIPGTEYMLILPLFIFEELILQWTRQRQKHNYGNLWESNIRSCTGHFGSTKEYYLTSPAGALCASHARLLSLCPCTCHWAKGTQLSYSRLEAVTQLYDSHLRLSTSETLLYGTKPSHPNEEWKPRQPQSYLNDLNFPCRNSVFLFH